MKRKGQIEETPLLLMDAAFASFVELGRRGTGHPVNPKRMELKRKAEATRVHEAYFKCPVKFEARRNILVLHTADLDRPFLTHNAELLEMLDPQLDKAVKIVEDLVASAMYSRRKKAASHVPAFATKLPL
jgi:hypothetical protein